MQEPRIQIGVRRPAKGIGVLDIQGEMTGAAEAALLAAYQEISQAGARTIALNLSGLESMNNSGLGLLITLLTRARRQKQRLLAYGLAEPQRQILSLSHLDRVIALYGDEGEALRKVAHV